MIARKSAVTATRQGLPARARVAVPSLRNAPKRAGEQAGREQYCGCGDHLWHDQGSLIGRPLIADRGTMACITRAQYCISNPVTARGPSCRPAAGPALAR